MKIIKYIRNRGIYNISALERAAGMPARTLHNAVNGQRELPGSWVYPLMQALGEIEIDGWKIKAYDDLPGYLGRRFDESRTVKEKEVRKGTGLVVEYSVPELRRYWGEMYFLQFIAE